MARPSYNRVEKPGWMSNEVESNSCEYSGYKCRKLYNPKTGMVMAKVGLNGSIEDVVARIRRK